MSEKKQYNTRQRAELIDYFRSESERWLSSRDIISDPKLDLSEATVYRMLTKLTEEGLIEKKPSENGRGAVYRFCGTADCHGHLHLRCLVCDSTICLQSNESRQIERSIGSEFDFSVDEERSTIYGVCRECKTSGGSR